MASLRRTNGSEPHHRVLLLESDQLDADRVTQALSNNGHTADVLRVDSESAFAEALDQYEPDVVISGSVPGMASRHALQLSREKHPEVPVLLLAGQLDREVVDSLRAGAADFVSKEELDKLWPTVDNALAQRAPLRRLSRRQREVFRLLASGVTMRDIASQLGLSRKTVETHRAQVMARLGARHVPELVRLAIRLGIVSSEG